VRSCTFRVQPKCGLCRAAGLENLRLVSYASLPAGIQQAGIARIEFKQQHGTVTDLVHIPKKAWSTARWRFLGVPRPGGEGRADRRGSQAACKFVRCRVHGRCDWAHCRRAPTCRIAVFDRPNRPSRARATSVCWRAIADNCWSETPICWKWTSTNGKWTLTRRIHTVFWRHYFGNIKTKPPFS